jgi:hypothetical protein
LRVKDDFSLPQSALSDLPVLADRRRGGVLAPEKALDTFNHCLTALRLLWTTADDVHI